MNTPKMSCGNSHTKLPFPSGNDSVKAVKKAPGAKASLKSKEDSNDSFLRSLAHDGRHNSFNYAENSEDSNQIKAVKKVPGSGNANKAVKNTPGTESAKRVPKNTRESKILKPDNTAEKKSHNPVHHTTVQGDNQPEEKAEDPPKTHDNLPFETEEYGLFDHDEKDITNARFRKLFNQKTHAHRLFPITNEPGEEIASQDENLFFNLFPNSTKAATHNFYFGIPSLATLKCEKNKRRVYNPLGSDPITKVVPNLQGKLKCATKVNSHRFYNRSAVDYLWKHYGCQYDDCTYDGKLLEKVGLVEENEQNTVEINYPSDEDQQGSADEDEISTNYDGIKKTTTTLNKTSNNSSHNKGVKKTAMTTNNTRKTSHASSDGGALAVKKKKTNGHNTTKGLSDEYFNVRDSRDFNFDGTDTGINSVGDKAVKKKGPRPSSGSSPFPSGMDSDGFHSDGGHPKKRPKHNSTFKSYDQHVNNSLLSDSLLSSKIKSVRSYSTAATSINSKSAHSNYSALNTENKTNKETNIFNSYYPTNSTSNNDLDSNIANYKRNVLNFRHSQRIDVIDYVSLNNNCSKSSYNKAFPKNKPVRPLTLKTGTYPSKKKLFNQNPEEINVFVDNFMDQDEFTKEYTYYNKKGPLINDLMYNDNDAIKEKAEKSVLTIMNACKESDSDKRTEVKDIENILLHSSTAKYVPNTTFERKTAFKDDVDNFKNIKPGETTTLINKKILSKKDLKNFHINIKKMTDEVEKISVKLKNKQGLKEVKTETDQLMNSLKTVNNWVGNQIEKSSGKSRVRSVSFDENKS